MKDNRLFLTALGFAILILNAAALQGAEVAVKVWQDRIVLPTYEEGLPDVNPPFDLFHGRSFITNVAVREFHLEYPIDNAKEG